MPRILTAPVGNERSAPTRQRGRSARPPHRPSRLPYPLSASASASHPTQTPKSVATNARAVPPSPRAFVPLPLQLAARRSLLTTLSFLRLSPAKSRRGQAIAPRPPAGSFTVSSRHASDVLRATTATTEMTPDPFSPPSKRSRQAIAPTSIARTPCKPALSRSRARNTGSCRSAPRIPSRIAVI